MTAATVAISVRFHGLLRQATGRAEERMLLPAGACLQDTLAQLVEEHGPALSRLLLNSTGALSSQFVIFHNNKLIHRTDGDMPLAEGDELMIFPRVSGG